MPKAEGAATPARSSLWGTGILVCGTLLILVLPSSGAVPPTAKVLPSLRAPFLGTSLTVDSVTAGNCSRAADYWPAFFNLTTGVGGFADRAFSKSCRALPPSTGNTTVYTTAVASGQFDENVSIPSARGYPTIFVNISYSASRLLSFTPGSCQRVYRPSYWGCNRGTEVIVGGGALLRDLSSNSTFVTHSTFPYFDFKSYNSTSCSVSGGCSYSTGYAGGRVVWSGTFSWQFTPTSPMNKSHRYVLLFAMFGEADTWWTEAPSSHLVGAALSATLNVASRGNGVHLISIVER
jgi:hypothetical protein